jgi:hypothetical protein
LTKLLWWVRHRKVANPLVSNEAKNLRSTLLAILLLVSPIAAMGQDTTPLNVRNSGAARCLDFTNVFLSSGNALDKTAYLQWISGYSAAAARGNAVVDIFPILDTMELVQMIAFVCGEDPEANLEYAVFQTANRLRPFWVRESANVLTLTWQENQTRFFETAVTALQEALNAAGASVTVDGTYGNETGAALTSLSRQAGLPAAPVPTGATIYLLTRPAQ